MTTFEKLTKRINDELDIEVAESSLHRTYANCWLRAAGAFAWEGHVVGYPDLIVGSCESATELLKAKKIAVVGDHFKELEICSE